MVDPADVAGGLRALPPRLAGRVPDDVAATVRRIGDALLDTLPRVSGSFEQEQTVLRTATDYLPRTLQAYAALPTPWAQTHRLPDGGTPLDALRTQLVVLEQATARMHDAAVGADASALLANGTFLADRFATSRIDLPSEPAGSGHVDRRTWRADAGRPYPSRTSSVRWISLQARVEGPEERAAAMRSALCRRPEETPP